MCGDAWLMNLLAPFATLARPCTPSAQEVAACGSRAAGPKVTRARGLYAQDSPHWTGRWRGSESAWTATIVTAGSFVPLEIGRSGLAVRRRGGRADASGGSG